MQTSTLNNSSPPELSLLHTIIDEISERRLKGRYQVIDYLGHGGMGVVFLARDHKLGRSVAIKVFAGHFDSESELSIAHNLFYKEGQMLASLAHPGIVAVFDVDSVKLAGRMRPFIVMEHLQGASLGDLAAEQPFTIESTLNIFYQLASALNFAHSRDTPVLHRDIKPKNVILTTSGRAVLIDFGLSRFVDGATTKIDIVKGSLSYMAPELLRAYFMQDHKALAKALHPKVDLFALGATMYFCLTGRKAMAGTTFDEILISSRNRLQPPSHFSPHIPPCVDHLAMSLLQPYTNQRVESAAHFAARLRGAAAQLDIDLEPNDLDSKTLLIKAASQFSGRPAKLSAAPLFAAALLLVSALPLSTKNERITRMQSTLFNPPVLLQPVDSGKVQDNHHKVAALKPPSIKKVAQNKQLASPSADLIASKAPVELLLKDFFLAHPLVVHDSGVSPITVRLRTEQQVSVGGKSLQLPRGTQLIGRARSDIGLRKINAKFEKIRLQGGREVAIAGAALLEDDLSVGLPANLQSNEKNKWLTLPAYTPLAVRFSGQTEGFLQLEGN